MAVGDIRIFSNSLSKLILTMQNAGVNATFRKYETDKLNKNDVVLFSGDSITAAGDTVHYAQWDSLAVVGVGNDIGMQGRNLKGIGLELRPDTCLTRYLVLYHNQIDTLYIQHTPRQQFVSMACGCAVYHTITAAWSSDPRVEKVSIINASVEAVAQDNLCIYLHE